MICVRKVGENKRRERKRNTMRIGTWNIKTMLAAGKMEQIAREMKRYSVKILALQETRWKGEGMIDKEGYTLYYSGEDKQGRNGTAFMIDRKLKREVIQFKPVNGRLCSITIKNRQANITVVNGYAPTEDAEDDEKTKFYETLEETCENIPRNDILLLVGDFNAKIGRENYNDNVAGKETIHDSTSDNGNRLCNIASTTNTFIVSTRFKHKKEHKITWMIPGRIDGNQIDHMLISRRWERIVHDVRSFRGANVDTDHILVIAKIKLKIIRSLNLRGNRKKWNTDKLNRTDINQEFTSTLEQKLFNHDEAKIEEEWRNIKKSIIQTADTVLGQRQTVKGREWYDDECAAEVRAKNKARNAWLRTGGDRELQDYKGKRSAATKLLKKKKTEWLEEIMREIEASYRDNRKLFQHIKRQTTTKKMSARIDRGNWESHFRELYQTQEQDYENEQQVTQDPHKQEEPPTYEEFMHTVERLKPNKAAGPDEISNELLKNGGEELQKRLYNLIVKIWREENMPVDWRSGLLTPIYKKGDPTICSNYRGIMLLNTTYKILTSIIRKRLEKYTEGELGDYQQGFRPGRSTIDAIHIITQTIEKCYEHNIELHMIFIDFKQAFDSIVRFKLIKEMENLKIPSKLIKLTKMTMEGSLAKVVTSEGTTEDISIETGVRQGDALSTTLFNIALEGAVRAAGISGNIAHSSKQLLAYADDIVLIARNRRSLERGLLLLEKEARERGLEINQDKTKYMTSTRRSTNNTNIKIGQYSFKQVESFKYLGVTINGKNERSVEVTERIKAGDRAYWRYRQLLKDKQLSTKTKLRVYRTAIRPVVTYAAEVMCLTSKDEERLRIFERKILRRILGPKKTDEGLYRNLMNFEVEKALEGRDIVTFIKQQRLRWFGHIQRRDSDTTIKKIYDWTPAEGRPRGRPKTRWRDQVLADIRSLEVENWRKLVKDRKTWKEMISKMK